MQEFINVKVIHLDGCDGTPPTIDLINKIAESQKINIKLEEIIVSSQEEAVKYRHIGSPTVQINELDIDPIARGVELFGLT
jgi:hypothetical protein